MCHGLQFCTSPEVSDKSLFSTFARTKPHDSQISMAVVSLLLTFNWTTIAFVYTDEQPLLAHALFEVPDVKYFSRLITSCPSAAPPADAFRVVQLLVSRSIKS